MITQASPRAAHTNLRRIPSETIRLRAGRKILTHGLRLGWRLSTGLAPYPVTVRRADVR